MAANIPGLSIPGRELLGGNYGGYGGNLLADQLANESDEERRRRLKQQQAAQLLPGLSAPGKALGLTQGGGAYGAVSGSYGRI